MLTNMIGNSLMLISLMTGSRMSFGSCERDEFTLSLTRRSPSSMSIPVVNSTRIVERPSFETDVICLMSLSAFSSRSRGCVINPSMSTGETPMYGTATMINGILTSGAASRGSALYDAQPNRRIMAMRRYTTTLLSTAMLQIFMWFLRLLYNDDRCAVNKLLKPRDNEAVSCAQPFDDLHHVPFTSSQLQPTFFGLSTVLDIDDAPVPVD